MRQRVGFIQASTFVPHLQCEILVPYKVLGKMRRKQTVNPWREARDDANFMWSRMPAIRQRLINPRTLEAREENGPAKSFKCNSSRSRLVTAFCSLSCDTSSSSLLRSRRHIILNAAAELRDMERAINFFSLFGTGRKNKSKIKRSSCLDLLKYLAEFPNTRQFDCGPQNW